MEQRTDDTEDTVNMTDSSTTKQQFTALKLPKTRLTSSSSSRFRC